MPGRNRDRKYDFTLGESLKQLTHAQLLLQASIHVDCALRALKDAERRAAIGRLEAAQEALTAARERGEQLLLWR
jgi:hypothetical protein